MRNELARRVAPTALALVALAAGVLPLQSGAASSAQSPRATQPLRVLVLGDSTAHGTPGDYTWRYFLEKALEASGPVEMVGPANDLYDEAATTHSSQAYADPWFDRDHAARWGNAAVWNVYPVGQVLANYPADAFVYAVGCNDLTFMDKSPEEVIAQVRVDLQTMRELNPQIDVAFVGCHLASPKHLAYNQLLSQFADQSSTPQSRLASALVPDWNSDLDTWDGGHPNQRGSYRVAREVVEAFARIGIAGGFPADLPPPAEGLRTPAILQARAGDQLVSLSWINPPGATSIRVWRRTQADPQWRVVDEVLGTAWVQRDLSNGVRYDYRLQAVKGRIAAEGLYSRTQSATPRANVLAVPRPWVQVPRDHRALVRWAGVPGATQYQVWFRNVTERSGWRSSMVTQTRWLSPRLRSGARYLFRVQAGDATSFGELSSRLAARISGPVPRQVRGLRVRRAASADLLTWWPQRRATTFVVQLRSPQGSWRTLRGALPITEPAVVLPAHRHGWWVRVAARHDLIQGDWSRRLRVG